MPNALTYLGPAISSGGAAVSQLGDDWEKKREYMQKLISDRAQVEFENRLRQEAADRQANEEKQKQAEADRALEYAKVVGAGQPAPAPQGTEIDTSSPDSSRPANVPLNDDERLQAARQYQQITPKDDIEIGVKAAKKATDDAKMNEFKTWIAAAGPAVERVGRSSKAANALMVQGLSRFGDIPGARDDIKAITQKEPAPPPQAGNGRVESTYITRFAHDQDNYEKKVNPFINLLQLKQTPTWGTGTGDISLINQLSLAEFAGYKPSDAEYNQFMKRMGLGERVDQAIGSLEKGAALAPAVRDRMAQEIEDVTKRAHTNFSKTIEQHRGRVKAKGINPDEVITPNGTYLDLEDYFKNKPVASSGGNGEVNQGGNVFDAQTHAFIRKAP